MYPPLPNQQKNESKVKIGKIVIANDSLRTQLAK